MVLITIPEHARAYQDVTLMSVRAKMIRLRSEYTRAFRSMHTPSWRRIKYNETNANIPVYTNPSTSREGWTLEQLHSFESRPISQSKRHILYVCPRPFHTGSLTVTLTLTLTQERGCSYTLGIIERRPTQGLGRARTAASRTCRSKCRESLWNIPESLLITSMPCESRQLLEHLRSSMCETLVPTYGNFRCN